VGVFDHGGSFWGFLTKGVPKGGLCGQYVSGFFIN